MPSNQIVTFSNSCCYSHTPLSSLSENRSSQNGSQPVHTPQQMMWCVERNLRILALKPRTVVSAAPKRYAVVPWRPCMNWHHINFLENELKYFHCSVARDCSTLKQCGAGSHKPEEERLAAFLNTCFSCSKVQLYHGFCSLVTSVGTCADVIVKRCSRKQLVHCHIVKDNENLKWCIWMISQTPLSSAFARGEKQRSWFEVNTSSLTKLQKLRLSWVLLLAG